MTGQVHFSGLPGSSTSRETRATPKPILGTPVFAFDHRGAAVGQSGESARARGPIGIDAKHRQLVFHIDGASFPNWEGQQQSRSFELHGDVLSYRVPPRPDSNVPISVWRRSGE